ncbi:MAG: SIR2 family protein [Magnetococcales bacterium]|nr:SIR2 family protein [Magnetococcales bacterium]MBF0117008.1 SIR2 family protein [Magnetococcales bacterium]
MDRDIILKLAQACFSSNPAIILGSGASMPHGLPSMGELQKYLTDKVVPDVGEEKDAWSQVCTALDSGDHLEKAMDGKNLPQKLTRKIVEMTWECVNKSDYDLFIKSIKRIEEFPLGKLLQKLSATCNQKIDVITPNYDRVVEYACNVHGLLYSVGFTPGYIQWREGSEPIKYNKNNRNLKIVRIWKVHGSLDWFACGDKEAFSVPVFKIPTQDAMPLIVTPGLRKFESTQYEPFRSIMTGADAVFESANGFICVGFGFRDSHIVPKLLQRCRTGIAPVAVIARTLTDEAKNFLRNNAGQKYIGLEESGSGTRAFTAQTPDGVELDGMDLWSLGGFLTSVT